MPSATSSRSTGSRPSRAPPSSCPSCSWSTATTVTSDKAALAKATVTVEVVAATKGPKIDILKYKNKTGYRKRQGHRQKHTQVKVTGIETGIARRSRPEPAPDVLPHTVRVER